MTEPQVFRRVETVEAMQYDGHNYDQIVAWMGNACTRTESSTDVRNLETAIRRISTQGGWSLRFLPSDWIVNGKSIFFVLSDEAISRGFEKVPVRIETFVDKAGEFRWRVVHNSNGETMGDSGEGYVNKSDRDHAVNLLWSGVPIREV